MVERRLDMLLRRLSYRTFVILSSFAIIYIYYTIFQLTKDVYVDSRALPVDEIVVRKVRSSNFTVGAVNQSLALAHNVLRNATENRTTTMHGSDHALPCITNHTYEEEEFTCQNISTIKIITSIGHGTTKEVFRGRYGNRDIAVKMVTAKVMDVRKCLERKLFWKPHECFLLANYKMLKEILFVHQLHHPNILKPIGYCVRNEITSSRTADHGVIYVTELGNEFSPSKYSKHSWEERMKIAIELLDLLDYFEHSPIGSLIMTDMKASQFIVVDGKVKLGDMDDVTNVEKECQSNQNCLLENADYGIQCIHNTCYGINAKFNLHYFNLKVFSVLLRKSPTEALSDETNQLLHEIKRLTAGDLRRSFQNIVQRHTERIE